MKDLVVHLPLPGYLRQWLAATLGDPVRFPPRSAENVLLTHLLRRRPPLAPPEPAGADTAAIVVPDNGLRPPETYNYLGRRGRAELAAAIERLFRLHLWSECAALMGAEGELGRGIDRWCEGHGIALEGREAVRQKFYRMRKAYRLYGIVLGKKYVKKSPSWRQELNKE